IVRAARVLLEDISSTLIGIRPNVRAIRSDDRRIVADADRKAERVASRIVRGNKFLDLSPVVCAARVALIDKSRVLDAFAGRGEMTSSIERPVPVNGGGDAVAVGN